jgi:Uma2 family endonuclease
MATSPALLSIEEYLRTSYRPDADLVDGQIEERNLGEFEYATLQAGIVSFFWARRKQWNIQPVTEQRIRVSEDKVRIADVALLRADAPREKVTQTPPLICIEILSPEDRIARAKLVLADYFAMGVPNIWLINPIYRAAFVFDAQGLHDSDPTNLVVHGTEIRLDLTEAFAAID